VSRRRKPTGVPGEPEPDPTRLGDALAAIGNELGLADPRVVGTLAARWPEVVGEAVAGQARLRSLRGDVLTIAVDSGAWATQLRYLHDDLLRRIAAMVGEGLVRDVRVVVEPR
jgi:predicted nucleic acid-binding Zn ribbon protein